MLDNMKHSACASNSISMRKRDGQFTEPKLNYHAANRHQTPEPIYQVQKMPKKHQNEYEPSQFNPNGSVNHRITPQRATNPSSATTALVYMNKNVVNQTSGVSVEKKNSKSLNQLNEDYQMQYFNRQQQQQQYHHHQQQQQHQFNKQNGMEYAYEPVKKKASHRIKDLMTDKIYKFERREMQQAFY